MYSVYPQDGQTSDNILVIGIILYIYSVRVVSSYYKK